MRRVRVGFAALLAVAGAACTPEMTEDEARTTLERFAAADFSAGHVCDADGRALLRTAARSYSAAMSAKGETWPSETRLASQTTPSMNNIESYAMMMLGYGFVTAGDLGGDAPRLAQEIGQGWNFEEANFSQHPQCKEIYGVMRESWAAVLEVAPIQRQIEAANERRDYQRLQRLIERRNRIIARVQARQNEVGRMLSGAGAP